MIGALVEQICDTSVRKLEIRSKDRLSWNKDHIDRLLTTDNLQEMYTIVYGIFYLISLLPWRVMYLISDVIAFILNHVVGYRKKVVIANLQIAFPEKSQKERASIVKQFYRQFTDNFIEVIKSLIIYITRQGNNEIR